MIKTYETEHILNKWIAETIHRADRILVDDTETYKFDDTMRYDD